MNKTIKNAPVSFTAALILIVAVILAIRFFLTGVYLFPDGQGYFSHLSSLFHDNDLFVFEVERDYQSGKTDCAVGKKMCWETIVIVVLSQVDQDRFLRVFLRSDLSNKRQQILQEIVEPPASISIIQDLPQNRSEVTPVFF